MLTDVIDQLAEEVGDRHTHLMREIGLDLDNPLEHLLNPILRSVADHEARYRDVAFGQVGIKDVSTLRARGVENMIEADRPEIAVHTALQSCARDRFLGAILINGQWCKEERMQK